MTTRAVSSVSVSVVICTRNPKEAYFLRVLEALKTQTLPNGAWELLLIDNASDDLLASRVDLSWHPRARHVREEEMGLTPARLRGIAEATAPLLVFVDDDNVLAADYLEEALKIFRRAPQIGAFGGSISGDFEIYLEEWMRPYLSNLAIRAVQVECWSNDPWDRRVTPYGAGMCVSSDVAAAYAEQVRSDPIRRKLDRVGASLSSSGDTDLALTSCDLGKGMGNFPQLQVLHLIPAERLTPEYFAKLTHGITKSGMVLRYCRYGVAPTPVPEYRQWIRRFANVLRGRREGAAIYKAEQQGIRDALAVIAQMRGG